MDNNDNSSTDYYLTKLNELEIINRKTEELIKIKSSIIEHSQKLEKGEAVYQEIISEKNKLIKEKDLLKRMLIEIQNDLDDLSKSEKELKKENEKTRDNLKNLREEYNPLKDTVDELRAKQLLSRLPNLQEEIDKEMTIYLEKRRNRWIEAGIGNNDISSEPSIPDSPYSTPSPSTRIKHNSTNSVTGRKKTKRRKAG
ncbi:hypothetical protein H8356DRAFT_1647481 [Neocallimastix lanati (nom. inval.)]|uniref:Uncharacterized protein n=1 Tax=Neocallimastix californiae TaxID=1754190 RepID=A0A1Y2AGJ5_9FUNG|nr:hypothetical protein H8356DRAFT_1647481 [Neocallimastix sp. JGI-2020a]ORY21626.1 hypothetical protein LY90DRAFT_707398 [Neocallimastix californiae]|eukprot:ORY21626.1 hypothetical protein LY90DRAFT_707398 [Neocallimastix californiae]